MKLDGYRMHLRVQGGHPISWAMVKPGLDPAGFRLSDLAAKPLPRDAWRGFREASVPLADAVRRVTRQ